MSDAGREERELLSRLRGEGARRFFKPAALLAAFFFGLFVGALLSAFLLPPERAFALCRWLLSLDVAAFAIVSSLALLRPRPTRPRLAAELDDAPATVRVNEKAGAALDTLGVRPGDEVVAVPGGLACGPVAVSTAGVRPWSAVLPSFPVGTAGKCLLAANLAALRAVIAGNGRDGGLKAYIAGTSGDLFEQQRAARAAALAASLTRGDTAGFLAAGRRLIGLGPGLTPAGDDFLAGLMLAVNMPAGPFGRDSRRAVRELADGAATGTVARAMLAHAARGRTRARIVALLTELTSGGKGKRPPPRTPCWPAAQPLAPTRPQAWP
jgi:hypothetical protein